MLVSRHFAALAQAPARLMLSRDRYSRKEANVIVYRARVWRDDDTLEEVRPVSSQ